MTEENTTVSKDATEQAPSQDAVTGKEHPAASATDEPINAAAQANVKDRKIPMTSIAVMIFILLVAFFCVGLQVVTSMVEAKNAPVEIKGKNASQGVDYPTLSNLPEGVAAEVNGVEIPESAVDDFIANMREVNGLESQDAWNTWMIENNQTTETIRNRVILYYVNQELIDQLAEEMDIHPTEADYAAMRETFLGDAERKAAIEEVLRAEGRTLDDYEVDIETATKRDMIGKKANAGTVDTPEFKEAVLKGVQAQYPEYASATTLDEVDPAIVKEVSDSYESLSNTQAFSNKVSEFIKDGSVLYCAIPSDVPYQSDSDAYFSLLELRQNLNKSGIFIEEGGLFDSLLSDIGGGAQVQSSAPQS